MLTTLFMMCQLAFGGSLAGVTLPDTASVGGESLVLNGMGLREKFFIDVYVGGLYVKNKSTDPKAIIAANEPKRIVMHFIYSSVPKDKMAATYKDGFAANGSGYDAEIVKLTGWLEDLTTGDEIVLDYVPGTGTTFTVKGTKKGTIEGEGFMKALWSVYLGDSPPTKAFKAGLLGG
jgi:hypothetical protein